MDSIEDLLRRLEQLNEVGASLSKERDITRLLETILLAAKTITNADGGTLYRMVDNGSALRFEILRTDSLHIAMGGTSGTPISFPNLPLTNDAGGPNDSLVAGYAAIHNETVNIADAYTEPNFDFSGTRRFDARTGYRSQSFLAVPMKNHEGEVIGVLQLINALEPGTRKVVPFSLSDQSLAESLASQAAIALTNRLLITQLEELFESFINLINLAIDEKSHYTGGHCQRVPALPPEAACRTTRSQQVQTSAATTRLGASRTWRDFATCCNSRRLRQHQSRQVMAENALIPAIDTLKLFHNRFTPRPSTAVTAPKPTKRGVAPCLHS